MEAAEHREPCESRGSCTDLGAPGGEIPPGDSTIASHPDVRDAPGMSAMPPIATQSVRRNEASRCANTGRRTERVDHISDEMRAVVESEWPELAHKLPPKDL